jgi:hypothetical protein
MNLSDCQLTRKDKMTNLRRLVGTGLLVLSMATVGWAGETLGGNLPASAPPPAAESTTDNATNVTTLSQPDASVTTADAVNVLVIWLIESIS